MRRSKLPLPLEGLVDQRAPARSQQMWRQIQARRAKRTKRSGDWLLLAAALAPLAVAVAWLGGAERWLAGRGGALRLASGAAMPVRVEPVAGYAALDLSDGSRVTVARRARLDVLESSGRAVSLALRHGRARFDVRPRGPRTWRIECGPHVVEVVGTAFVIERTPAALQVEVLRGAVLVRGGNVPDRVQRLNAGQRLRVDNALPAAPGPLSAPEALAPGAPAPTPALDVSAAEEGAGAPAGSAGPPVPVEFAPGWRAEARSGEPARSARAAEALSGEPARGQRAADARANATEEPRLASARPQEVRQQRSERAAPTEVAATALDVEALLREADALRLAGRPEAAVAPLTLATEAGRADPRAGLAAFALARLHLGVLSDPQQARRDLERALALGLPLALQEDAYIKLVEAHERVGDGRAACAALAQYARRFPRGRRGEAELRRCRADPEP